MAEEERICLRRGENPGEYHYGKFLIERERYYSTTRWSVRLAEDRTEVHNTETLGQVRDWLRRRQSTDGDDDA